MIRITNSMMTNNTKSNINNTKTSVDKYNTMIATGQKITKPSDDPVIAIRALRLNTNISQLTQYYEKNIPDATAWFTTTETALSQTDSIFASIKENLTTGASDDNTESDRMKILQSLKALRDQIYASGNADYADRTVFTGYRTSESLTVLTTDNLDEIDYPVIVEPITADDIESITYVAGKEATDETGVLAQSVTRIRLAYDQLKALDGGNVTITCTKNDKTTSTINLTPESLTGSAAVDDALYTDGATHFIADTGEIIIGNDALGDSIKAALSDNTNKSVTVSYGKSTFQAGDLRPEHYFSCVDKDGIHYNYDEDKSTTPSTYTPNFVEQDIEYEVSFNQTIKINTHASDVFSHDIGRDVDELCEATQACIDAEDALTKVKAAGKVEGDPEYDAAQKLFDLMSEKTQKMFSNALTRFEGYADATNLAIADIGSMKARLTVTKERVQDQLASFKTLADENINAELTDTAIDLSNSQLALEAAQMAAGKIAQQTLLNYL